MSDSLERLRKAEEELEMISKRLQYQVFKEEIDRSPYSESEKQQLYSFMDPETMDVDTKGMVEVNPDFTIETFIRFGACVSPPNINGVILAGGKASRYDYMPKWLQPLPNGETVLSQMVENFIKHGFRNVDILANYDNANAIGNYIDNQNLDTKERFEDEYNEPISVGVQVNFDEKSPAKELRRYIEMTLTSEDKKTCYASYPFARTYCMVVDGDTLVDDWAIDITDAAASTRLKTPRDAVVVHITKVEPKDEGTNICYSLIDSFQGEHFTVEEGIYEGLSEPRTGITEEPKLWAFRSDALLKLDEEELEDCDMTKLCEIFHEKGYRVHTLKSNLMSWNINNPDQYKRAYDSLKKPFEAAAEEARKLIPYAMASYPLIKSVLKTLSATRKWSLPLEKEISKFKQQMMERESKNKQPDCTEK